MTLHKMTAGTVSVIVEYDMKYHPLFVYARLIFHLYCPLTSVNFNKFNCTNNIGIGMHC